LFLGQSENATKYSVSRLIIGMIVNRLKYGENPAFLKIFQNGMIIKIQITEYGSI
jgi:hypothetical protein